MFVTGIKELCAFDAALDLFFGICTSQTLGTSKAFLPISTERNVLALYDWKQHRN